MVRGATSSGAGLLVFALAAALLGALPAFPAGAAKYEMERTDRVEEKRKILERLKKDRAKIDLAIDNTKTLLNRSRQRPYLPDLYLRLAELYIERSRVVYFIRREESPDGAKAVQSLEAQNLKRDALEVYRRVLDDFPAYAHRDKVLFFMAHELRELGQIDEMLARYRELLASHKTSTYAPEAYLLLGDHFFNAKDLELALRHYQAVLDYPDSPAVAAARYKLGWCYVNQADWKTALKLFEEAVTTTDAAREIEIDTYRKVDIKLESLVDMAYCYPEEHKDDPPEDALRYFERFAWSRPVLTTALEKLAQRYYVKKKWQHAAYLFRKLSALRNDPEKLLEYAAKVFDCERAVATFERADEDLDLIVKALKKQRYSIHIPKQTKEKTLKEYELYARDIATHLHHRAREQGSVEAFRTAAAAYRSYLEYFDASEARAEIQRNLAEALFAGRQFLEAGKEYEKASKAAGLRPSERDEVLYGAVLSYYSALKEGQSLTAYGKVYARSGLRTAGPEYAKAFPSSERVPNVLFNVAWVAYDEGRYDVAVEEFQRFVERYPGRTEAGAAVHLTLDAYNLKEDHQGLVRFGEQVLANAAVDPNLKREVAVIVQAGQKKILSPLAVAAAEDWGAGKDKLLDFAEQNRANGLGQQALEVVLASSAKARDLRTLFRVGTEVLRTEKQPDKVEQTLSALIDSAAQSANLRQLAALLEDFAQRLPEHKSAPEFLSQAARLRAALGQRDRAAADYDLLLARLKGDSAERSEHVLQAAQNAVRGGDPKRALAILEAARAGLEGTARIQAEAKIAVLHLAAGRRDPAEEAAGEARRLFEKAGRPADAAARDALGEWELARLAPTFAEYMALKLGSAVDEATVQRKTELFTQVVDGYDAVAELQRPASTLAAYFRAYEAHGEFARFLEQSPPPADLTAEQLAEYTGIVKEKAEAYRVKGMEYRHITADTARKLELCDPEVAAYLTGEASPVRAFGPSALTSGADAANRWLQDEKLVQTHGRALEKPDDPERLLALAKAYVEAGDPLHAAAIAQKAAEDRGEEKSPARASLFNALGVAYLLAGRDDAARDALRSALADDPGHPAARLNLSALFRHYGHFERADALCSAPGAPEPAAQDLVHPRARELCHGGQRHATK